MKKFLVIYASKSDPMEMMKNATPEEMEAGMKPWIEWYAKKGDAVVDQGNPAGNGHKITKDGVNKLENEVAGYTMIQAESMEIAQEILKDHPHLDWDNASGIDVYEVFEIPAM